MKAGFSFFAHLKRMSDATQSDILAAQQRIREQQNAVRATLRANGGLSDVEQEHTPNVRSRSWNWELAFGVGCGARKRHQFGRYKQ